MVTVQFDHGTLVIDGPAPELAEVTEFMREDPRIGRWRAPAHLYANIVGRLHRDRTPYQDHARQFQPLSLALAGNQAPRDFQAEALAAWEQQQRRGYVVLPTGSGKSFLALLAIARTQRPTLVVVPTLDLMEQWAHLLNQGFGGPIGLLGGGSKEVQDLTVSTYESAAMLMEFVGNRFGFLIVDECHHLPSPANRLAATMSIAPFRLGLTATPERQDGAEAELEELLGPLCYRRDIDELEGKVLSPYRTHRLALELDPDESVSYHRNRQIYMEFVHRNRISFADPNGWSQFIGLCARHPEGRAAFQAYLEQKRVTRTSRAKFRAIWKLLQQHVGERMLIFTADNDTAYELGRQFFLPVLTHHTKLAERREFLAAFRTGAYPVLVTSNVLNEGIDVPEASIGVVVSGSGSIREHVQRLGRLLRPVAGKEAHLYELISLGTTEQYVSERRRQHRAYQRPHPRPGPPGPGLPPIRPR